jgi:hypothetical protein
MLRFVVVFQKKNRVWDFLGHSGTFWDRFLGKKTDAAAPCEFVIGRERF